MADVPRLTVTTKVYGAGFGFFLARALAALGFPFETCVRVALACTWVRAEAAGRTSWHRMRLEHPTNGNP